MDVTALASAMSLTSTDTKVNVGVLKAVQNLSLNTAAELFASLGVGSRIDASA